MPMLLNEALKLSTLVVLTSIVWVSKTLYVLFLRCYPKTTKEGPHCGTRWQQGIKVISWSLYNTGLYNSLEVVVLHATNIEQIYRGVQDKKKGYFYVVGDSQSSMPW